MDLVWKKSMERNNNVADYAESVVFVSADELFPERELKSGSEPTFSFQSDVTILSGGKPENLDTRQEDNRVSFEQNLKYWNNAVAVLSVDIAEKVIRKNLDEEREQMDMIDRLLDEVLPASKKN